MFLSFAENNKEEFNTLNGYSFRYSNISNSVVDLDFFVYNEEKSICFCSSLNEYISEKYWLIDRLKNNADLGFSHTKCHLNSLNSVCYNLDKDLKIKYCDHIQDPVFVYDYPWSSNYQHWLITAVSRLMLFLEMKQKFKNLKLLHTYSKYRHKDEILELFGIRSSDVISHDSPTKFNNIILPDFISCSGKFISDFALQSYQKLSENIRGNISTSRKIYLARNDKLGKRPMSNREELDLLMEEKGFKKVLLENLSLSEKIYLFRCAEFIVGDFSAGWGHIVFCSPNVKLILLEHDVFKFSKFYSSIAVSIGAYFISIENTNLYRRLILCILKIYWKISKSIDKSANSLFWHVAIHKLRRLL